MQMINYIDIFYQRHSCQVCLCNCDNQSLSTRHRMWIIWKGDAIYSWIEYSRPSLIVLLFDLEVIVVQDI